MAEPRSHPPTIAVVTITERAQIDRLDTYGATVSAESDSGRCDDGSDPLAEGVEQALHAAEGDHPKFFGCGHAVLRPDTLTACS